MAFDRNISVTCRRNKAETHVRLMNAEAQQATLSIIIRCTYGTDNRYSLILGKTHFQGGGGAPQPPALSPRPGSEHPRPRSPPPLFVILQEVKGNMAKNALASRSVGEAQKLRVEDLMQFFK